MPERQGGRGKCAACSHDRQAEIDAALLAGKPSLRDLAAKYGIAKSSLQAHKAAHLNPALATVRQDRLAKGARTAVERLENLVDRADALFRVAEGGTSVQSAAVALRELRGTIELLAKITGELDERPTTVINLLTTAEWIEIRTHLRQALAPFPDAWEAVSASLTVGSS